MCDKPHRNMIELLRNSDIFFLAHASAIWSGLFGQVVLAPVGAKQGHIKGWRLESPGDSISQHVWSLLAGPCLGLKQGAFLYGCLACSCHDTCFTSMSMSGTKWVLHHLLWFCLKVCVLAAVLGRRCVLTTAVPLTLQLA